MRQIRKFMSNIKQIALEIDKDSSNRANATRSRNTCTKCKHNINDEMMQYYHERRKMYEAIDTYELGLKYGTLHFIKDKDLPTPGNEVGDELLLFVDDSPMYGFMNGVPVHHYEIGYYVGHIGEDAIFESYRTNGTVREIIAQDVIAWVKLPQLSTKLAANSCS